MTKPPAARRLRGLRAFRRGRRGEHIALIWLLAKGFWPLARRYRTRQGEIDIIARRGRLVIFVEVKAQAARPGEALTMRQQKRIERAARLFAARAALPGGWRGRFDAILIRPWRLPVHLADAFRPAGRG